ncbi:thiamine-phosphate diphosphorylase/ thiamine-phosphate pyrophosphorylase [Desulfuromonas soudanensis]|uniref:Thiamine-phosphate synthase n=1 Tax=Desulfuromonas soudanensis TaxID=1603606 RepID=A0A0M4CYU5_9BACT|nr:thiamine-phosphate diphosphorylase/ thiamine-phosphate pyrophosphorylase [Desulfuromonas soudanensis]
MDAPPRIDFPLYLITDRLLLPAGRTLIEAVTSALEGGVRAVQLREKDLDDAALYPLARELRALTRAFGARLLINDRIDLALAIGADGVHLGGNSLPTAEARRFLGPAPLIGVSTHRLEEIAGAASQGADFVTFGPVYFTASKAPYGEPVGLEALRCACIAPPLPVFALGGIQLHRISEVLDSGVRGIALISAILSRPDPAGAAREILARLKKI